MALGSFRTAVRTSGANKHFPFEVEFVRGRNIRCYIGRIFDPDSIGYYGEQNQKAWPNSTNKISKRGLQSASSYNRADIKVTNHLTRTRSASVFFKGSANVATHGRASSSSCTETDEAKGYVEWTPSGMAQYNYIVLHRETAVGADGSTKYNRWLLSSVTEAQLNSLDIVIACIENYRIVNQIWKSDVTYWNEGGNGGGGTDGLPRFYHPFQIVVSDDYSMWEVRAGSVNGEVHSIPLSTLYSGTHVVWLICYPTISLQVGGGGGEGSICVGSITKSNGVVYIDQLLSGSIWFERFKCGDDDPKYWYSRI